MKRKIIFRGKSLDDGSWVYGSLLVNGERATIVDFSDPSTTAVYDVNPDTVGQFVGRCDKSYKDIYTGDIVKIDGSENLYIVSYFSLKMAFVFKHSRGKDFERVKIEVGFHCNVNVVGNVYDNRDILSDYPESNVSLAESLANIHAEVEKRKNKIRKQIKGDKQ